MKKGIKKIFIFILIPLIFPVIFINLLTKEDKRKEIKEQPHIPHFEYSDPLLKRNIFTESISRTASEVTFWVNDLFHD